MVDADSTLLCGRSEGLSNELTVTQQDVEVSIVYSRVVYVLSRL